MVFYMDLYRKCAISYVKVVLSFIMIREGKKCLV